MKPSERIDSAFGEGEIETPEAAPAHTPGPWVIQGYRIARFRR